MRGRAERRLTTPPLRPRRRLGTTPATIERLAGTGVAVGGSDVTIMAGPCSVEGAAMLKEVALVNRPATPQQAVRELARLREALEEVDGEMLKLVVRRATLAAEAGEAKRVAGLPLLDPEREARVVEIAAAAARDAGIPDAEVRQIFRLLIIIARKSQEAVP